MRIDNPTKIFLGKILDYLGVDRYSMTLEKERGFEDMIDDYVLDITDPIVENIEAMKKIVDDKILSYEIGELQEGFPEKEQKELDVLYEKQQMLAKIIDMF